MIRLMKLVVAGATLCAVAALPATGVPGRKMAPRPGVAGLACSGTCVYVGAKRVARFDGQQLWGDNCYEGSLVTTNKQRTWINLASAMSGRWGFARLIKPGRWDVYSLHAVKPRLVGYADRRNPLRWDVLRANRTVAHTLGPDGPEAAAAFLIFC